MQVEDGKVIELGSVSADTRGLLIGMVESDAGYMRPPSLDAD